VAVDFKAHTITPLNDAVGTGPFCFDGSLGLLSLGSDLGGVVALNTSDASGSLQAITVLRKDSLGGILGNKAVDCADGILVAAIVDWRQEGAPMALLAFDFRAPDMGQTPLHNSTIEIGSGADTSHSIHMLQIADRAHMRA
jgi:hypothetical protein